MSGILNAPKFVDTLPANQRASIAPRRSELDQQAARFVAQLAQSRKGNEASKMALAAENVVSTSSIYEALRKAGCEVRVVRKTNPDGSPMVERRNDSTGQPKDYPICDIYAWLPEGPVQSRSGRKPWVAPAKRLAELDKELSDRNTSKERRAEIEAEKVKIFERNPKLAPAA